MPRNSHNNNRNHKFNKWLSKRQRKSRRQHRRGLREKSDYENFSFSISSTPPSLSSSSLSIEKVPNRPRQRVKMFLVMSIRNPKAKNSYETVRANRSKRVSMISKRRPRRLKISNFQRNNRMNSNSLSPYLNNGSERLKTAKINYLVNDDERIVTSTINELDRFERNFIEMFQKRYQNNLKEFEDFASKLSNSIETIIEELNCKKNTKLIL
ncbi:hypothetical protein SSS_08482 [Sarcoptes scabiei]|uniref:Uncharacterized protein n=1 Tax=Sarcoptes scabiei TaxID=52283 RepID=A0A834VCU5_SARSC|nr:hypothetical protein SSS_08482 [Sarcoptes scabiei]